MGKLKDISGNRYGELTVVRFYGKANNSRESEWECICDCGNMVIVRGSNLKKGNTTSCGCKAKERLRNINLSHDLSGTKLYSVWKGMKTRCNNSNTMYYQRYGGRGIKVCDEWDDDFKVFYDWANSNGFLEELTLDRIDNNGNYCPENCRWVDMKEQSNNTRKNRCVTYQGETKNLAQWCEYLGISGNMVRSRLHRGWSEEKALSTPVLKR